MKKIISFILMFALAFSTFITVYAKPDSKNHKEKATIENKVKEKESKVKQEEIKTQKQEKAKEKVEAKEQKEFKSKVKIKGVEVKFDVPPVIKDGHVLIPVRAITKGIGAKLDYDKDANIVTITKGDITIVFDFNTSKVYVNGKEVVLETEAEIINGRTLVPIRFISETLGERVNYDKDTQDIDIEEDLDNENTVSEDVYKNLDETVTDSVYKGVTDIVVSD